MAARDNTQNFQYFQKMQKVDRYHDNHHCGNCGWWAGHARWCDKHGMAAYAYDPACSSWQTPPGAPAKARPTRRQSKKPEVA